MLSIKDELLQRVVDDFDTMLNATVERMKEHQEDKGEVTLKLTIQLDKDYIVNDEGEQIPVDVPIFEHTVKSKWSGGQDFKGAITERLFLVGKEKEEYHLVRRKDAQLSMFDQD